MTHARALTLALLAAGCSSVRATGTVDGTDPAFIDAFYVEQEGGFGDDGALWIQADEIRKSCETFVDFQRAAEDGGDDPGTNATLWAEAFPQEFWGLSIVVRTTDPTDPFTADEFDGTDWEGTPEKSDEFKAVLSLYDEWLDEEYWGGTDDPSDYIKTWFSDEGNLTLDRTERDGVLKATLEVDLVDVDEGEDAGSIEVHLRARPCPEFDLDAGTPDMATE